MAVAAPVYFILDQPHGTSLDVPLSTPQIPHRYDTFITTWETTTHNGTITIPGTGNYTVNWGDGHIDANITGSIQHQYDTPGEHTVTISGNLTGIRLGDSHDAAKLQSIDQWGSMQWRSMERAFAGASNMIYWAPDAPDLSRVTTMSGMFDGATLFNGDLSNWDVSNVTDMSSMFYDATTFNGDLSSWDVSNVTDMSSMFHNTLDFNGDLSSWDVSNVTNMSSMFEFASAFNGDLSSWDVSNVTNMSSMFEFASAFNGDLSSWDVSNVRYMGCMLSKASAFNGDLSSWGDSNVADAYSACERLILPACGPQRTKFEWVACPPYP